MYTIQLLAPFILNHCISNIVNNRGDICNTGQNGITRVKYYEPGKSCYRNGIFYPRCEDLHNPQVLQNNEVLKSENDQL